MNREAMYTDGEYLKNNSTWGVEDAAWKCDQVIQLMEANKLYPGDVIEVGCGSGAISENLLASCSCIHYLKGFDISPQAIALAKSRENEKIIFSQEDLIERTDLYTDLMLVIDVVEHIGDFYGFLNRHKPMSNYFIFQIPMDLCCRTLLKPHVLKQQRDAVGHIHYFSEEMIYWLLQDCGYEIIQSVYTKPATDRGFAASFKSRAKKQLRNLSFSINKKMSIKLWGNYSLMILAK